ncbi:SAM-dependent methyltransferase [Legionella qingyii]|uniref:SAM-dependent methyltransferase n=1 Tax=Legionella qingyii TaxID=2184757 RepID=UPI000F8C3E2A|nr:SAM-dependent methyltransferase [Legionella qingyii]RUR24234.1 methylase [Legionella qingyii]
MSKLIVCGSGIKSISHITEETKHIIKHADKVLYLVNEPNLKEWIKREAKEAESLDDLYFNVQKRIDAYNQITNHIINEYNCGKVLCVVFYGHPTIFADPALKAVRKIKAANGNAVILPGISTMDCLFSDLQIDPGDRGCFTIDVTELLIYERTVDVNAHVILWQLANLGMHNVKQTSKLNVLSDYLRKSYKHDHSVCIYEAALMPMQKPRIEWIRLDKLSDSLISPLSTLYIPPMTQKKPSKKYINLLEIDIQNYQLSSESDTATK